jgi:predicted PurR-regulated permease PerM
MMEGIVIGVIVFLVIYALIKAWRKYEHADEIVLCQALLPVLNHSFATN